MPPPPQCASLSVTTSETIIGTPTKKVPAAPMPNQRVDSSCAIFSPTGQPNQNKSPHKAG